MTGQFQGTASFGSFTITSAGAQDIFVAKYDTDGNVLWVRSAGGPINDQGFGIGIDAAVNIYVTGFLRDTAIFGSFTLTSAGVRDIFVAKYDDSGNVLWVRSAGGTSFDEGSGIAVDAGGNSYATGRFSEMATFAPISITSLGGMALPLFSWVLSRLCSDHFCPRLGTRFGQ